MVVSEPDTMPNVGAIKLDDENMNTSNIDIVPESKNSKPRLDVHEDANVDVDSDEDDEEDDDMVLQSLQCDDMYAVLGVGVDASTQEVQQAYRRLVLEYHPDRNPDPIEAQKFHLITTAGSVLRDRYRRMLYDMQHNLRDVPESEVSDVLSRLRTRASRLIENMKETVQQSREIETKRSGLIILKALYGDLRNRGEVSLPPAPVIDVTTAMQCMVQFSELVNESRTKMFIDGFFDPCPYRDKALFIRYIFKDAIHQVCYDDKEPIRIPMRQHHVAREDLVEEFLHQTWGTFPLRRTAEKRRHREQQRRQHYWLQGARLTTSALAVVGGLLLLRDVSLSRVDGILELWQRSLHRRR